MASQLLKPPAVLPGQGIQIEQVRNRRSFNVRAEFCLSLQQDEVIRLIVVLNIVVSVRRQWRIVGVHAGRIDRAGTVGGGWAVDIAVAEAAPLTSRKVERVNVRSKIVIMAAAENDHRPRDTVPVRIDSTIPGFGDRRKADCTAPRCMRRTACESS